MALTVSQITYKGIQVANPYLKVDSIAYNNSDKSVEYGICAYTSRENSESVRDAICRYYIGKMQVPIGAAVNDIIMSIYVDIKAKAAAPENYPAEASLFGGATDC